MQQRVFLLLLATWAGFSGLMGQSLSVSGALNFGTVTELATDSLPVTLQNITDDTVQVQAVRFYDTYGKKPFSCNFVPTSLAPGATLTLYVRFHPRHNILHESEMLILTDGNRGDVSVDLKGQGQYSNPYYSTTQNLSEEALKTALKTKIGQNYTSLGYNSARDAMYMDIDNKKTNGQGATVNTLECVYTNKVITGYTDRASVFSMGFNCEHTFPQGQFNQDEPMRSDMHHLFPTREDANGSRGNYEFGWATTPYKNDNINAPSHLGNNYLYEPQNSHKGAVARAMLYFVLRYQDYNNYVGNIRQDTTFYTWHKMFPPDSQERTRNNDIYSYQFNRNPFVDYPQFLERIRVFLSNSTALPVTQAEVSDTAADFGTFAWVGNPLTANYQVVIENTGNQAVTVNNISLKKGINFTSSSSVSIQPGEAGLLPITFTADTSGQFTDTISFNVPSVGTVSLPLAALVDDHSPVAPAHEAIRALQVWPNPTHDVIRLRLPQVFAAPISWTVTDNTGRVVKQGNLPARITEATLSLEDLPAGLYRLAVSCEGYTMSYPVMYTH